MGALNSAWPTLIDVSKAMAPDGSIAQVAEVLTQSNEALDDIPWLEGNLPTGHQSSIRTSIPTPSFRLLNGGVVPVKSSTGQITDTCAILEARNNIDVDVAMLNGNTKEFRKSQDDAFIEGFNQTLMTTLIYGDSSVNPQRFDGLASRYYTTSTATATVGAQVLTAGGGTTNNTSIYLVGWGPNKVFGMYPKGSQAGLQHKDLGITDVVTDYTTGAIMRAYSSWFQWKCGLVVADYRYVVRIANINSTQLLTASDATDTSANILKLMIQALGLLPNVAGIRPVFYMNKDVQAMLAVKLINKGNVWLSMQEIKHSPVFRPNPVLTFQGVPCRRVDAILNNEGVIS